MHLRSGIWIVLSLLLSIIPSNSPVHIATLGSRRAVNTALSPEIEAQIRAVATMARNRSAKNKPDPRLFGSLLRLEEMLPRSAATRRAQERGKKAYLAMLSTRSPKLLRRWPATRKAIEREMQRDITYTKALEAVDKRLAAVEPVSVRKTPVSASPKGASLPFDQMRPGDIMIWDDRSGPPLVRVAISLYASKCTHTAIYLGEAAARGKGVQRWTLEAQSPALGVRTAVMGRKWTRPGLHVALGHVQGIAPGRAAQIAKNAVDTYGADGRTPYHIWPPWDKTYCQEGLYCSQLVWCVYQQNGVDLDSNDWHYLAWFTIHNWFNPYAAPTAYFGVFPDEIKASPRISWYYDQANP
jgi:cell wall-associated NlpC family hydrolase